MLLDLGNRSAAVQSRVGRNLPGVVEIGQVAVPGTGRLAVPGTEVVLTGVDARARLEEVSGAAK